jgi:hypothetical protein
VNRLWKSPLQSLGSDLLDLLGYFGRPGSMGYLGIILGRIGVVNLFISMLLGIWDCPTYRVGKSSLYTSWSLLLDCMRYF